jgi:hypothetical protein
MLSEFQWQFIGCCRYCHCPIYWNEDQRESRFMGYNCDCELEETKLTVNSGESLG